MGRSAATVKRDREYMRQVVERQRQAAVMAEMQEQEEKRKQEESIRRMTIKQHFSKIHTLRGDLASWYRDIFQTPFRKDMQDIKADVNLSATGRMAKEDQLRTEFRQKVLNWANECHKLQEDEFEQITKKARAVLDKPTPKPEDLTVERFRRTLSDLKADMSLGLPSLHAVTKISQLADSVTDPYLGEILRDEFAGLVAMAGQLTGENRLALSKSLEGLRTRTKSPEQVEAEDALEGVALMRQSNVFGPILTSAVGSDFGHDIGNVMNSVERVAAMLAPEQNDNERASA